MKKNFKLKYSLLILILSATIAGCSSSNQTSDTNAENIETSSTGETVSNTINEDWPTLRVAVSLDARAVPPKEMAFEQELNKEAEVNIEYITLPGDATEKKNLMLASNDLPDVFMGLLSRSDIMKYKEQGVFIPVNDLVENEMPLLKELYEKHPEYKKEATAIDGNMYGFPRIEEMKGLILNQGLLYINQTWLDNLKLPMPTTMEEYKNTLIAFRDNDPNGNGAQDEIPFTLAGKEGNKGIGSWSNGNDFGQFLGCFGQADTGDSLKVNEDGIIFSTATTDAFKEGYKFFHDMYAENLIDIEIFNNDTAMLSSKLRDPDGIVGSVITFSLPDRVDNERYKEYSPIPYLTGTGGEYGTRENLSEMHNPVVFSITSACETPEIAARYADLTYDPVKSVEANWGPLDYVYEFDEKGQMVWGELKDGYDNFDDMRNANVLAARHPLAIFDDYYGTVVEYPQNAQNMLNDMNTVGFIDKHLNDPYIAPQWYEEEDANRLAILSTQVYGTIDTYRRQWIIDGGVDEQWNDYINDLEVAGLDELISIVQKYY
ncbi:MAG: extracellular solute-binding protein [Lachnospirales bacterium]